MTDQPATMAQGRARPKGALLAPRLMVGVFVLLKLAFDLFVPPINDEAYYWLWGQRPGLSYFDHPPLHAWLQGVVGALFGWNMLSLRLLTWVTLAGTLMLLWRWTRRLALDDRDGYFWTAAAIYLASPVMMAMTTIAFHDHLMLLLCLASAYFFLAFLEAYEIGRPRWGRFFAAAVLLGLAVLTKYNAVFLGFGFALAILTRRELRPLLRDWRLWLGGLVSIAIQAPVLWWNLTEGLASYKFHLTGRLDHAPGLEWGHALGFLAWQVFWFSPFLIVPALRYAAARRKDIGQIQRKRLALATLAVSVLAMAGLTLVLQVLPYWTDVGYALLIVFLVPHVGRWSFWGHMIVGVGFTLVMLVNLAVLPIATLFGGDDWGSSVLYGWPQVAARMRALEAEHPGAFLAATHYNLAAPLGYQLHTADITTFSPRSDQFDYWFDPRAHVGQDALLLADGNNPTTEAAARFQGLTLLSDVTITRFGHDLHTFQIYLGTSYCGGPCQP